MKVSDKDFDQLFSSKLANMEMEPSAHVWNNIADELDGKKKDKGGIGFMQIAAAVVIIMGISLFFIRPKNDKIQLGASVESVKPKENQSSPAIEAVQPQITGTQTYDVAEVVKPKIKQQVARASVGQTEEQPVYNAGDTAKSATTAYIAAVNEKPPVSNSGQNIQTPNVVKGNFTPASSVEPVKTNTPATTTPVLAALNNPVNNTAPKADGTIKKHRIHSLGDLLNVVIAKVDKRQDKLVEFTNNSDDDSFNVTGVNIGVIRAKREN